MKTTATVIETDEKNKTALVSRERESACAGCSQSEVCLSLGACDRNTAKLKVRNPVGAKPGDCVEIETRDGTVLWYALLVFILPLAMAGGGYAVSELFGAGLWVSVLCGAAMLALGFIIIRLTAEKKAERNLNTSIIRIVRGNADGDNIES